MTECMVCWIFFFSIKSVYLWKETNMVKNCFKGLFENDFLLVHIYSAGENQA